MARTRTRTPLLLFGIVAVYVALQSAWWAWLLLRRQGELATLQRQLLAVGEVPEVSLRPPEQAVLMITGEGIVFLVLLLVGLWITYRTLQQELSLARQQRDFLLATSHELRTPIAGLRLHLQTLRRTGLDDAQRHALAASAMDDLDRLTGLTEKILLATRLDEAQLSIEPVTFDANAELRDICLRATASFGRGHRIEAPDATQAPITADLFAFRSVAVNLLENACKYAPQGTRVRVSLARAVGGSELTVTDEGPGVRPEERERIFEKFYRAGNEETRGTKGTGLGLYIARRLMVALGGRIEYRDALPHGAIFAATFPKR